MIGILPDLRTAPYRDHVPVDPPEGYVHVPWHSTHHIQVGKLALPNSVEWLVCQICAYARSKRAWRFNQRLNQEEYAVEFTDCTDGFVSVPQLLSKNTIRNRVRLQLLVRCIGRNATIGVGPTREARLRVSGNVSGDTKKIFVVGEMLTVDGKFLRKIGNERKGLKIRAEKLQEFALA